ncbi:MAG: hypothetical protein Q7W55_15670 [Pseudohongiella sp.]|nr:hypothetical protein [Pseudohongiella sp.]MDO9519310.1 hypothetical protein [Pseudohongiella sp.]MDP2126088.1 hypothetical protein [Pseudohongiella sp.]
MSHRPELQQPSPFRRLVSGHYGLALTYWILYLIVAGIFFVAGSAAVADGNWSSYTLMLGATLTWTFILLFGIQRAYKGEDPGKALGRIAILFLLLNMTNALATLSFI